MLLGNRTISGSAFFAYDLQYSVENEVLDSLHFTDCADLLRRFLLDRSDCLEAQ